MAALAEGLRLVQEAVNYDTQGQHELAIQKYDASLVSFEQAIIAEQDPQRRTLYSQKVKEYQGRSQELKEIVAKKEVTQRIAKMGVGTLPSQQHLKSGPTMPVATEVPVQDPFAYAAAPSRSASAYNIPSQPIASAQFTSSSTPQFNQQIPSPEAAFSLPTMSAPETMSKFEALRAGEVLIGIATAEDAAHRYENSLQAYKAALDYLVKALQEESNPDVKMKLSEKMRMYFSRAEQIGTNLEYIRQQKLNNPYFQQLRCEFCTRDILINEDYKNSNSKNYHIKCFDETIGLIRDEHKTFLTSKDPIKFHVEIPKKTYWSNAGEGEEFGFKFSVDNQAGKKVLYVVAHLLKTETYMQVLNTGERRPQVKEVKGAKKKYYGLNNQFPMEHGKVEVDARYTIPAGMDESERPGAISSFVREYEFIVKAKLAAPHGQIRISFPIFLQKLKTT
eukprot:TRINITY_DN7361_c0_g1_i1.p1 TRINITY_DN7361_c0_g1~~TRINITY_DN7361_c0_g1_i1.p1  ORF type:complete len:448 (+),score=127.41 TRINITY_DN7361_c0_g1_i1:26-1369(+)